MLEISPHLSTMLHTSPAGPALAHKLLYLCLKHYRLDLHVMRDLPSRGDLVEELTYERNSKLYSFPIPYSYSIPLFYTATLAWRAQQ